MKEKNITQYKLITEYHVSAGQLSRLRANAHVSTHTLDILCNILECDISDIVSHIQDSWEQFPYPTKFFCIYLPASIFLMTYFSINIAPFFTILIFSFYMIKKWQIKPSDRFTTRRKHYSSCNWSGLLILAGNNSFSVSRFISPFAQQKMGI